MNVIYYLIPVAIVFIIVGVIGFFWATKTEQFDDLEKQGLSILSDDDVELTAKSQQENESQQKSKE